ncbi:hypothetical protein L6706_004686 [Salmonella enterica]|nr:hypothetical protein [Salmonella enterica]EKZ3297883.1 hypothetical protein [Salmonella enterica]
MKTQTFDNVFDAICDTPEQAENMKIRARLMSVLNSWIEIQGYMDIRYPGMVAA